MAPPLQPIDNRLILSRQFGSTSSEFTFLCASFPRKDDCLPPRDRQSGAHEKLGPEGDSQRQSQTFWAIFLVSGHGGPPMSTSPAVRRSYPTTLSLDPDAARLIRALCPNSKGMGLLVSELIRREA